MRCRMCTRSRNQYSLSVLPADLSLLLGLSRAPLPPQSSFSGPPFSSEGGTKSDRLSLADELPAHIVPIAPRRQISSMRAPILLLTQHADDLLLGEWLPRYGQSRA